MVVICTLSYDSLPKLTHEIHCTFKTDTLKCTVLKSKRYMMGKFMSLLTSAEFSFEKILLKMSHGMRLPTFYFLTSVDSDKPLQPPFKLRNSKLCAASSLTIIEYSCD